MIEFLMKLINSLPISFEFIKLLVTTNESIKLITHDKRRISRYENVAFISSNMHFLIKLKETSDSTENYTITVQRSHWIHT